MIWLKIKYRARYWWNQFCRTFIGVCGKCGSQVNYTTKGRAICPKCKT